MRLTAIAIFPISLLYATTQVRAKDNFNVLQHLGANGQWFPGPDVFKLGAPEEVPSGCEVDRVVYMSRHGSRYPDPGAWDQWNSLYQKFQSAKFTSRGSLSFLPTWKPVLQHPSDDISQVSITGYKELYDMGTTLRFRHPTLYAPNQPFTVWANNYPRTIDSARLFARGFAGPNSTLVDVVVVNSTNPLSIANSLATSDLFPLFKDDSSNKTNVWDALYLPPIVSRLQKIIKGNLTLTSDDVSLFPYLCGFESQIVGRRSPWCSVFTEKELVQYEYRQDLRYWYGTGLGTPSATKDVMLPIVQTISTILASEELTTSTPLLVAFTHDNQINELASASGVFDQQPSLPANRLIKRTFVSSRINPMKGTIAWERLTCSKRNYVRVRLNDAVYHMLFFLLRLGSNLTYLILAIARCDNGPGRSCPVDTYAALIQSKMDKAGSFEVRCNSTVRGVESTQKSFFEDLGLEFLSFVKP